MPNWTPEPLQDEKEKDTAATEVKDGKKAEAKTNKTEQKPKTFEKKSQRGEFHGGFRKDSNPDVIYGRDLREIPLIWNLLPVRWEKSSSVDRLWMWKHVRSVMKKQS